MQQQQSAQPLQILPQQIPVFIDSINQPGIDVTNYCNGISQIIKNHPQFIPQILSALNNHPLKEIPQILTQLPDDHTNTCISLMLNWLTITQQMPIISKIFGYLAFKSKSKQLPDLFPYIDTYLPEHTRDLLSPLKQLMINGQLTQHFKAIFSKMDPIYFPQCGDILLSKKAELSNEHIIHIIKLFMKYAAQFTGKRSTLCMLLKTILHILDKANDVKVVQQAHVFFTTKLINLGPMYCQSEITDKCLEHVNTLNLNQDTSESENILGNVQIPSIHQSTLDLVIDPLTCKSFISTDPCDQDELVIAFRIIAMGIKQTTASLCHFNQQQQPLNPDSMTVELYDWIHQSVQLLWSHTTIAHSQSIFNSIESVLNRINNQEMEPCPELIETLVATFTQMPVPWLPSLLPSPMLLCRSMIYHPIRHTLYLQLLQVDAINQPLAAHFYTYSSTLTYHTMPQSLLDIHLSIIKQIMAIPLQLTTDYTTFVKFCITNAHLHKSYLTILDHLFIHIASLNQPILSTQMTELLPLLFNHVQCHPNDQTIHCLLHIPVAIDALKPFFSILQPYLLTAIAYPPILLKDALTLLNHKCGNITFHIQVKQQLQHLINCKDVSIISKQDHKQLLLTFSKYFEIVEPLQQYPIYTFTQHGNEYSIPLNIDEFHLDHIPHVLQCLSSVQHVNCYTQCIKWVHSNDITIDQFSQLPLQPFNIQSISTLTLNLNLKTFYPYALNLLFDHLSELNYHQCIHVLECYQSYPFHLSSIQFYEAALSMDHLQHPLLDNLIIQFSNEYPLEAIQHGFHLTRTKHYFSLLNKHIKMDCLCTILTPKHYEIAQYYTLEPSTLDRMIQSIASLPHDVHIIQFIINQPLNQQQQLSPIILIYMIQALFNVQCTDLAYQYLLSIQQLIIENDQITRPILKEALGPQQKKQAAHTNGIIKVIYLFPQNSNKPVHQTLLIVLDKMMQQPRQIHQLHIFNELLQYMPIECLDKLINAFIILHNKHYLKHSQVLVQFTNYCFNHPDIIINRILNSLDNIVEMDLFILMLTLNPNPTIINGLLSHIQSICKKVVDFNSLFMYNTTKLITILPINSTSNAILACIGYFIKSTTCSNYLVYYQQLFNLYPLLNPMILKITNTLHNTSIKLFNDDVADWHYYLNKLYFVPMLHLNEWYFDHLVYSRLHLIPTDVLKLFILDNINVNSTTLLKLMYYLIMHHPTVLQSESKSILKYAYSLLTVYKSDAILVCTSCILFYNVPIKFYNQFIITILKAFTIHNTDPIHTALTLLINHVELELIGNCINQVLLEDASFIITIHVCKLLNHHPQLISQLDIQLIINQLPKMILMVGLEYRCIIVDFIVKCPIQLVFHLILKLMLNISTSTAVKKLKWMHHLFLHLKQNMVLIQYHLLQLNNNQVYIDYLIQLITLDVQNRRKQWQLQPYTQFIECLQLLIPLCLPTLQFTELIQHCISSTQHVSFEDEIAGDGVLKALHQQLQQLLHSNPVLAIYIMKELKPMESHHQWLLQYYSKHSDAFTSQLLMEWYPIYTFKSELLQVLTLKLPLLSSIELLKLLQLKWHQEVLLVLLTAINQTLQGPCYVPLYNAFISNIHYCYTNSILTSELQSIFMQHVHHPILLQLFKLNLNGTVHQHCYYILQQCNTIKNTIIIELYFNSFIANIKHCIYLFIQMYNNCSEYQQQQYLYALQNYIQFNKDQLYTIYNKLHPPKSTLNNKAMSDIKDLLCHEDYLNAQLMLESTTPVDPLFYKQAWITCAEQLQQWDILMEISQFEQWPYLLFKSNVYSHFKVQPLLMNDYTTLYTYLHLIHTKQHTNLNIDKVYQPREYCIYMEIQYYEQLVSILNKIDSINSAIDVNQPLMVLLNEMRLNINLKYIHDVAVIRTLGFEVMNRVYAQYVPNMQSMMNTNTLAFKGFHELAHLYNIQAKQLINVNESLAITILNSIYALPNIEIDEAFIKLQSQLECCLQEPLMGLELLKTTNTHYFNNHYKSEFSIYKGKYLESLSRFEECNEAYMNACQLDVEYDKAWSCWGRYQQGKQQFICYNNALMYGTEYNEDIIDFIYLLQLNEYEIKGEIQYCHFKSLIPELIQLMNGQYKDYFNQLFIHYFKLDPETLFPYFIHNELQVINDCKGIHPELFQSLDLMYSAIIDNKTHYLYGVYKPLIPLVHIPMNKPLKGLVFRGSDGNEYQLITIQNTTSYALYRTSKGYWEWVNQYSRYKCLNESIYLNTLILMRDGIQIDPLKDTLNVQCKLDQQSFIQFKHELTTSFGILNGSLFGLNKRILKWEDVVMNGNGGLRMIQHVFTMEEGCLGVRWTQQVQQLLEVDDFKRSIYRWTDDVMDKLRYLRLFLPVEDAEEEIKEIKSRLLHLNKKKLDELISHSCNPSVLEGLDASYTSWY